MFKDTQVAKANIFFSEFKYWVMFKIQTSKININNTEVFIVIKTKQWQN